MRFGLYRLKVILVLIMLLLTRVQLLNLALLKIFSLMQAKIFILQPTIFIFSLLVLNYNGLCVVNKNLCSVVSVNNILINLLFSNCNQLIFNQCFKQNFILLLIFPRKLCQVGLSLNKTVHPKRRFYSLFKPCCYKRLERVV